MDTMMNNRGLFTSILFCAIIVISGCKSTNDKSSLIISKEESELIKGIIKKEYAQYNSPRFDSIGNCCFNAFVETIDSLNGFYDATFNGLLIKYYHCPYNDFYFTIIKGTSSSFYYIGLNEIDLWGEELTKFYYNQNGFLVHKDSILTPIKIENNSINEILEKEPLFKIPEDKLADDYFISKKINLVYGLIYNIYYSKDEGITNKSFLGNRIPMEKVEAELIKIKDDKILDVDERKMVYNSIYDKISGNIREQGYLFKLENEGLLFFDIKFNGKKLILEELFIPQLKRQFEFKSDLNYKRCN